MATYSFSDVVLTLSHQNMNEILSTNGQGIGTISINMNTELTQVDVASDGVPVVSKKKDTTGTLSIEMQQTSGLHTDLKRWMNYLTDASAQQWAIIKGVLTSNATGEQYIMTGGSISKMPDASYTSTAGNVTWNFVFTKITQNII